ncbi:glycosyl hydrolase 2 galactose-binding domain-containing protein [Leifsonia xyli]|uniref:glycosyl hydrolase 2 galactose-binding domain-containing protein n=1 Tax=Leifsonia xyli TaxID=1575 RepID=UPI003D6706D0
MTAETADTVDLAGEWTLRGWRQNDWLLGLTPERGKVSTADIGPIPAPVPGSVRGALVRAGITLSPYRGTDSRASEWIENRHWTFERVIPAVTLTERITGTDERVVLEADMLDGEGVILIGETVVGEFTDAFVRQRFDITDSLDRGEDLLTIVFTRVPDALGQNGWTSRIRDWKPRFSFGWDWTPRTVQIGIADGIRLRVGPGWSLDDALVRSVVDHAGDGEVEVDLRRCGLPLGAAVEVSVFDGSGTVVASEPAAAAELRTLSVPRPRLWHVHPTAEQALYTVRVDVLVEGRSRTTTRQVGFRTLEWRRNPGSAPDADPWLCVVNDQEIFLAGVNWVPLRADHADVSDAEIRTRLRTYRDLGFNVIRVWGGARAERPAFYDECDRLGVLIWQDLPLSSSGLDNEPPSDPSIIEEFRRIAADYVTTLGHHPALALWCGGNELTRVTAPAVPGAPLTLEHPTLRAAGDVCADLAPATRYVATTPSGPRFEASAAEFGRGIHHDVHGPWEFDGDEDQWQAYWAADDALFRSEVGVAGASGADLLEAFGLLPDGLEDDRIRALWTHSSGWWLAGFDARDRDVPVEQWLDTSAQRQARMLVIALERALGRFPATGGFMLWMGHDTFPCAVSLAVVDFWGRPKPAALALRSLLDQCGANLSSAPH